MGCCFLVFLVQSSSAGHHCSHPHPSMVVLFLSVLINYSLLSNRRLLCSAGDSLAAGQSMSVNQTVVAAGQTFTLGFFSPGNSSAAHLYAGIWYNRVPERTVVWVANRENPLKDPAGVLAVTSDGNIAVLDGAGGTVWSTNLSGVPSNTSAVLLDSGNLVLRHGEGEEYVWQSFEHPTDTLLPLMRLRSNLSTGAGLRLTSWRGAADPSPGEFVFTVDPKNSLQPSILKGSEIYWRGTVWDGKLSITRQLGNLTSLYVQSVVKGDDDIYWTFYMVDNSILGRYVINYTGIYTFFYWVEGLQQWIAMGSLPTRPCDFYNRCGPFGACVYMEGACRCLDGFEPRSPEDWKRGNFTGGCVRRHRLLCDGTDRFVKLPGIKLPDGFSTMWNKNMEQCEAECSASCRCQAYAYANFSTLNKTGSRCLIWLGEMKDLGQVPIFFEDLYMRFPASELDNGTTLDNGSSSGKNKGLMKIILPVVFSGMLLLGLCCCFIVKRLKSRVDKRKTRKLLRLEDFNFSHALSQENISDVPLFAFKSVKAATSNFSGAKKLGEGGFGSVYKGELSTGHEIAVKRLSKGSSQGYQEFANEITLIAKLQHKNLVRLLGWCIHKAEKILIYEYMPNKSLDSFLFDTSRSMELSWEKRFKIIDGIAHGLLYLHEYSRMRVIHRDLKTSNILLDSEMNPRISDFGLARIFKMNQAEANTRNIVGTYGYMSPEYALDGIFSEKSDVFSFGVIILEIITGKRSIGFYPYRNSLNLLGYVWQMWEEGRALEIQDPSMGDSFQATEGLSCIQLGLLCIQEDAADRPTMSFIVSMLSSENCTLPIPKQPAFAIGRNPNPVQPISHDRSSNSRDRASKSSTSDLPRSSSEGC